MCVYTFIYGHLNHAFLDYSIRVRQCSIQLYYSADTHARTLITINIIKYLTGLPAIWITAAVSLGFYTSQETIHLVMMCATVNSLLSYGWDIVMDWGLVSLDVWTMKCSFRNRYYFHFLYYLFAIIINLLLRFSWTITLFSYFRSFHSSHIILWMEVGEIIRRCIWNNIRIEWEVIVNQDKLKYKHEQDTNNTL